MLNCKWDAIKCRRGWIEFLISNSWTPCFFLLPRNQRNKFIYLKPSSGVIRTTRKMSFITFLIYDLLKPLCLIWSLLSRETNASFNFILSDRAWSQNLGSLNSVLFWRTKLVQGEPELITEASSWVHSNYLPDSIYHAAWRTFPWN